MCVIHKVALMTAMAKNIPTPGTFRRLVMIKTREINETETMESQTGESITVIIAVAYRPKFPIIPFGPPSC